MTPPTGYDGYSPTGTPAIDSFRAENHMPPGGMTAKDLKGLGDDGVVDRTTRRGPLTRLRSAFTRGRRESASTNISDRS
jgi:hypothetical protein